MRTFPRVTKAVLAFVTALAVACFDAPRSSSLPLELWRSDGTPQGTYRVKRLPGHLDPTEMPPVALGDELLFTLTERGRGLELWRSDGTEEGTVEVVDLLAGRRYTRPLKVYPDATRVAGGKLYFTLGDGAHGSELWQSDGTVTGTSMVKDIVPGPGGSTPRQFASLGHRLFFFVDFTGSAFPASPLEPGLWTSDGTAGGTVPLKPGPWEFGGSAAVGDALLFRQGQELWRSDGSLAGTLRVGPLPIAVATCAAARETFFCAGPEQLWKSDGTAAGTMKVKDIPHLNLNHLVTAGTRVFFTTIEATRPHGLWTSDGSAGGTSALAEFPDRAAPEGGPTLAFGEGFAQGEPTELTAFGESVFFGGFQPETGYELWRSDGTPAGTGLVVDLEPGPESSFPSSLAVLGDRVLFRTSRGLWISDGTEAGTEKLLTDNHYPELTVAGSAAYWLTQP